MTKPNKPYDTVSISIRQYTAFNSSQRKLYFRWKWLQCEMFVNIINVVFVNIIKFVEKNTWTNYVQIVNVKQKNASEDIQNHVNFIRFIGTANSERTANSCI